MKRLNEKDVETLIGMSFGVDNVPIIHGLIKCLYSYNKNKK